MTIQDTIPTWSHPHMRDLQKDKIKEFGETIVFVDKWYYYSAYGPEPKDRYYFRIKLKHKK